MRPHRDGKWFMAVHVTISNFTPKPHTPFQWHSVSTAEFERKRAMLREAFSGMYQVGGRHELAWLLGSSISAGVREVSSPPGPCAHCSRHHSRQCKLPSWLTSIAASLE